VPPMVLLGGGELGLTEEFVGLWECALERDVGTPDSLFRVQ
jgi:hypothetical protein